MVAAYGTGSARKQWHCASLPPAAFWQATERELLAESLALLEERREVLDEMEAAMRCELGKLAR